MPKVIQQTRSKLASIMLGLAIAITSYCVYAQTDSVTAFKNHFIDYRLNEKLEYYRHQYQDISFLLLKGDGQVLADMILLGKSLGRQPISMDYEHPPDLREELIKASVNRIQLMLQYKMPSASLFLAGDKLDKKKNICVLTIHPGEVAADSVLATRNLLDLPHKLTQKVPKEFKLDPADYLEFVFDHEVYHCLQSMFVGPQKMSYQESWGKYNSFHNEQGADVYAIAMNINTHLEVSAFARNIMRIRGLSLYSADPDHLTCKALQQIFKVPVDNLAEMNAKEIFELANNIRQGLTISYDEYIQYLASSIQAMKELGVEDLVSDDLRNSASGVQSDPEQVKELVINTHRYLSDLSCSELE